MDIEILGRITRVNCPQGQEQALQAAADELNERLSQMRQRTQVNNAEQLLAIAALNAFYEVQSMTKEAEKTQSLSIKMEQMTLALDTVLTQSTCTEQIAPTEQVEKTEQTAPTEQAVVENAQLENAQLIKNEQFQEKNQEEPQAPIQEKPLQAPQVNEELNKQTKEEINTIKEESPAVVENTTSTVVASFAKRNV